MSRVFIGRRFDDAALLVLFGVVVVGLALGGLYFAGSGRMPNDSLFWPWAIAAAFTIVRALWIAADRRWAVVTDGGLTVVGRRGDRFLADEDVIAIGVWDRPHSEGGKPRHRQVKVELVLDDGRRQERVRFSYRVGLDDRDPLKWWRKELLERLEEQALRTVVAGGEFGTDHWQLSRDGFTWTTGRKQHHIPAEEITAADEADGALCVWRTGDERPAFRLPIGSPNALVLWGVIARGLRDGADERPRDGELGRLLFERRLGGPFLACVVYFFSLLMLGGGGWVAVTKDDWTARASGVLIALLGAAFFFGGWVAVARRLSMHTDGVRMKGRFGTRQIPFAELCEMTWLETRHYYHGVYTGTHIKIRLRAVNGATIRFDTSVNNIDFGLDELRQSVAGHVAKRMRSHLARGHRVPWVGRLSFTPDGLAVAPWLSWFGGEERILSYESLDWELNGDLKLRGSGHRVSVPVSIGAVNFQPGLVLLEQLRACPQPELASTRRA